MEEYPGNNLQLAWKQTLEHIDELMQLGLLEHLKATSVAGFDQGVLEIRVINSVSYGYLSRSSVKNHILILAKPIFERHGLDLREIYFKQT